MELPHKDVRTLSHSVLTGHSSFGLNRGEQGALWGESYPEENLVPVSVGRSWTAFAAPSSPDSPPFPSPSLLPFPDLRTPE